MLGSISWEQVALLARVLVGAEYDWDDVDWEAPDGDRQLGRVPDALMAALADLPDERLQPLSDQWHALLVAHAGWSPSQGHTLREDLDGMRCEAQSARKETGGLWLRIEP
jgi:hypothetical protein